GGILCSDCTPSRDSSMAPIAPDVLAMLNAWQRSQQPRAALRTHHTPRQLDSISRLLGGFLSYHLDTPLVSRSIALDILARKPGGDHREEKTLEPLPFTP
ncbi:MAG: hypothetical protein V2A34_12865, partial [Lentisphaerota bacterium]